MPQGEVQSPDLGSEKNNKMKKEVYSKSYIVRGRYLPTELDENMFKLNYKEISGSIKRFQTENG